MASIQQAHHLTQDEALEFIRKGDKRRAAYHNEHCPTQWGHGDTYDLTINSSRLGLSGTTDFLEDYIRRRIAQNHDKTKTARPWNLPQSGRFPFLCQRCCK